MNKRVILKQGWKFIVMAIITGMMLVGCSSNNESNKSSEQTTSSDNPTPQSIVALDWSAYDTLRAVGLEDHIVGAPTSLTPDYLQPLTDDVKNTGQMKSPDLEVIANLKPNLIVSGGRTSDLVPDLEKITTVYQFKTDNTKLWESIKDANINLGKQVNKQSEVEDKLKAIEEKAKKLQEFNSNKEEKTLVIMLNEGKIAVYGEKSRFGLIYSLFGFKPTDYAIEDATHGQSVSYESIKEINPDRIFVIDRTKAIGKDATIDDGLLGNELIQQTNAAKNNQIVQLDSSMWYLSGNGLLSIEKEIDDISKAVGLE